MTSRSRVSVADLHKRWNNESDLAKMSSLLDLREFLRQCIITAEYTISDSLNASIALSDYGDWLQRELGKKKVPIKEARLLCFLEFYHLDLLVDIDRMDPSAVADGIGEELLKKRIHLPHIMGPGLYLKAAELFPEEKYRLGNSDTMRLLDNEPIGVFQLGKWVSGPYGMLSSRAPRALTPTLSVPLQHCHDVACRRIHRVYLETDQTAAINEHRAVAQKILDNESAESSDYSIFFGDVFREDELTFDDFNLGTLPLLLGDCLADAELRCLLIRLVEDDSTFRAAMTKQGLNGKVQNFADGLGRGQLLQLCLLAADEAVVQAIDSLTEDGSIFIPNGEVRRPVLFPEASTGAFGTRLELSEFGVKANVAGHLAPLRLRRLIDAIYNRAGEEFSDELDWHLREVPGKTLAARLDEFLRTASPKQVISDLVLSGREPAEIAIRHLGISNRTAPALSRSQLMDRILWKLGFVVNEPRTVPQRFWELHEELAQSARSALVSTSVNEEAVRGLSANYFEQLERVLSDSLAFAAWALSFDHVTAERPFHYDDDSCRDFGLQVLQLSPCNIEGPEHTPLEFSDHSTLYGLCRGFAILADHLQHLGSQSEDHLRSSESMPRYTSNTTLRKFPFRHVAPFLDLVPASRTRIVEMLQQVSRDLVRARVSEARNAQVHYRRAASDLNPLIESLEAIRGAVRELEDLGLVRALFTPRRVERDEWDRTTAYLADARGREVVLGRPSEFSWLNLPAISSPQYLVVSAQFADPNEVLRFTIGVPSDFTKMWSGIPARRRDSGHVRRTRQSEQDSTLRLVEPTGD